MQTPFPIAEPVVNASASSFWPRGRTAAFMGSARGELNGGIPEEVRVPVFLPLGSPSILFPFAKLLKRGEFPPLLAEAPPLVSGLRRGSVAWRWHVLGPHGFHEDR